MEYEELRRKIKTFSLDDGDLGSQGYKRVLLQLFGLTGHGKSSFINSCKYVLNEGGPFVEHAEAGERPDGGSMTLIRKACELTSNITMVDNRGCGKISNFERTEVYAQLGNFHPLDQPVVWKKNFKDMMMDLEDSDLDKNATDFIVPIFIYSGLLKLSPYEEMEVKDFLKNCDKMTGVVPIIALTNKAHGDFSELEKKFRLMGMKTVIAIENYTKHSKEKSLGRTNDILKIIAKALENVTSRLSLPRDPNRDWIERKKFLLNYIFEAEVEYEKAKTRKIETSQEERCVLL